VTIRFIPCRECAGIGRVNTSRCGGNDPDTWLVTCKYCQRSGHECCSECSAEDVWIEPVNADYAERVFPLCAGHMALYVQAAAE